MVVVSLGVRISHKERGDMNKRANRIERALKSFFSSKDFVPTIVSSVKAESVGDSCSVELLPSGCCRISYSSTIGDKYASPGVILQVSTPPRSVVNEVSDEISLEEVIEIYSDEIKREMEQKLSYALDALEEMQ
jgi:hypothetical protein